MNNNSNYGFLLNQDIKLYRQYFNEMARLIGIKFLYYPLKNKDYTSYTEIINQVNKPEIIYGIMEEHPEQQTLKKLGWMSELQDGASIIHVPYDLKDLQQGSLFVIPSGLDCAEGRLFRVSKLSNIMIYPASISCQIVPEYKNTFSNNQFDYKHTEFNLLNEEEE